MKNLGFGMMRLPMPDAKVQDKVDKEQVCSMVDTFLERGFTYFDTAYFYHKGESERVVKEAIATRVDRERFLLADKLPISLLKDADNAKQEEIFAEQFEKCGVEYFDYYLLHCLTVDNYATAQRLNTFEFLLGKKAEGKIRHLGFSSHDKADVLDQILTEHPEVEFVQLQINYLDWEDERVQSRKCYETAVKHGKKVIVMEPVKGGRLATVPAEVEKLMKDAHPDWSPASWAIRSAASLENVMMVLSGMSSMEQMVDNVKTFQERKPLSDGELATVMAIAALAAIIWAIAGQDFSHIADYLINSGYGVADPFMCLADFESYMYAYKNAIKDYGDKQEWAKKSLMNTATSGVFASDNSIRKYANEIWHITPINKSK